MSIYSIGVSGLNAAQNALRTTSNNISNVYTPGFNREIAQLANNGVSGGVRVTDIERQFNQFVANQLNDSLGNTRSLEAYQKEVSQINNLLADREAGLSPLMQNFFSSIQDLAAGPADPATRQGMLGTADIMTSQFRAFDGYLKDMQDGVNGQIRDEVIQINNLTEQLGGLNREISMARASRGEEPNGLLDQRDYVIQQINERMDVRLNIQDGKTYNISLPNGQQLVTGTSVFKLHAVDSPTDPQRTVVAYQDGRRANASLIPLEESLITGGTLGGLMTFRSETLDKTQNQIGQLAASMVIGFNDQHRLGRDLNGDQGGNFFDIGQPITYANDRNSGTAEIIGARFDEPNLAQLRATDYEVRVNSAVVPSGASDFTVIRKDTGEALDTSALTYDDNGGAGTDATLSFGGVILTFDDIANLRENDRFEVQPVRRAAGGMETVISDLDKVAAGLFVTSSGDMASEVLTASSGAFSNAAAYDLLLNNTGNLEFAGTNVPANVQVNGETRAVSVGGVVQASDTVGTDAALSAGDVIIVDGVSFRIDGLPGSGDADTTLILEEAASGPGDNRNALALQNLQSEQLVGGRSTLTQAYAGMVSDVGNRANIVQVNLDASLGITEQLEALQQSESGVNLDEEAANLIRFQQFYAANARVIDTASTLFDTILGLRN
ncbi:flagellar hook-associated protein FlgK [Lamprobacter modestohalophilus]|uniref:Flagellar hook-associated protein 1 n=1 Tax=Lamprobacter modestohalophilus TaxID=1064514 RepID=A0A9X0W7P3_9GAMM|nr:flagellar hook-associated protein FlgK [Lamprobacter modestohalophilus]MBK1618367.1 flagellar hook-associated protein FlgK [Lamprobacter modestohalophilus]